MTFPEPSPTLPATCSTAATRGVDRWWLAGLLLLTVLAYGRSIGHDYAIDSTLLVASELPDGTPNPFTGASSLFQSGERSLGDYFTANYWAAVGVSNQGLYRPLPILSYALANALPWAEEAAWQHGVNLALHLVGILLVFRLLSRLGVGGWARLAAAALCAVHAVRIEAVVDVVGRAELLAFCFGLGGVLCWLPCAVVGGGRGARGLWRWVAAAVLWWAAFLSKESAVVWPAVAIVLAWARQREDGCGLGWSAGLLGQGARVLPAALPAVGLWWWQRSAMLAGLEAKGIPLIGLPEATVNQLAHVDTTERLLTATTVWGAGFLRLLVPWPLVSDLSTGSWQLVTSPWELGFLLSVAAFAVLVGLAIRLRQRLPLVTGGLILLFGMGLITSNLLFPIGVMAADRLWYAPMLGLAVVLVGLAQRRVGFPEPAGLERSSPGRWDSLWRYGLPIWLAAQLALVSLRVPEWRDNLTLLQTDAARLPENPRLHELLGAVHVQRMEAALAAEDVEAAVVERDAALAAYREAVTRNPSMLRSWHGLSRLQFQGNDPLGALRTLNEGLEQAGPDAGPVSIRVDMLTNRAGLLEAARPRDAVADLEQALQLEPDNIRALHGILQIGDGVLSGGRWKLFLDRLVDLDPNGMETAFHQAEWAFRQGEHQTVAERLRIYSRVINDRPVARRAEALLMQAESLNRLGRFAEGNRAAQRVLADDEMPLAAKRRAEGLLR